MAGRIRFAAQASRCDRVQLIVENGHLSYVSIEDDDDRQGYLLSGGEWREIKDV